MRNGRPSARRNRLKPQIESLELRLNLALPTPFGATGLVTLPGAGSPWTYDDGVFIASSVAADINGSGKQDILAVGGNGKLYAYKYDSTANNMIIDRVFDPGAGEQIDSTPVVTTLPSGTAIFAATHSGEVIGWNAATGSVLPGWPQRVSVLYGAIKNIPNAVYGAVAVGDLNGNGIPDIVVTSRNQTVTAFHADGSLDWQYNNDDTVFTAPVIADLNGDGRPEVIFGGDSSAGLFYDNGGRIVCLSSDGHRVWIKATDQVIQGSPVVADLLGNGHLDVIASTGPNFSGVGNKIYAVDANGNDLPGWPYQTAPTNIQAGTLTSPVVADLQGNGTLDVVYADGQGKIHAVKPDGTDLWTPVQPPGFAGARLNATPIIADINGSGNQEIILNNGNDIYALDGLTGRTVWHTFVNEFYFSSPTIANVKGDGTYQLAYTGVAVSNGTVLSPSYLRTFQLDSRSVAPAWGAYRQDAGNQAVHRSDAVMSRLISSLWTNVLGRTAGADAYAYWLPIFRESPALQSSIRGITGSYEARAFRINNYYTKYLNRPADPNGLQVWVGFLNAGNNDIYTQASIVSSDEFYIYSGSTSQGYITRLYQLVLGRTPQNGEEQNWVNILKANPAARSQVAFGFLNSPELTQKTILNWYSIYAPGGQTLPTSADLYAASWDLRRGTLLEPVLANIIASGNYYTPGSTGTYVDTQSEASWLKLMYRDVLKREASQADLIFWLTAFERGFTFATTATAIINSSENHDIQVASYFLKYLNQPTTQAQRVPLVNAWNSGAQNGPGIQALLISSDGYYAAAGGTPTGFINKVYQDVLKHAPDAASLSSYLKTPIATVRTILAPFLLRTQEYGYLLTTQLFYNDLRRFPYTQLDSSAVLPAGVSNTAAAQPFMNFVAAGGTAEDILQIILLSPEYLGIAKNKAFWSGARWKNLTVYS